jgi:hypothetical protein
VKRSAAVRSSGRAGGEDFFAGATRLRVLASVSLITTDRWRLDGRSWGSSSPKLLLWLLLRSEDELNDDDDGEGELSGRRARDCDMSSIPEGATLLSSVPILKCVLWGQKRKPGICPRLGPFFFPPGAPAGFSALHEEKERGQEKRKRRAKGNTFPFFPPPLYSVSLFPLLVAPFSAPQSSRGAGSGKTSGYHAGPFTCYWKP